MTGWILRAVAAAALLGVAALAAEHAAGWLRRPRRAVWAAAMAASLAVPALAAWVPGLLPRPDWLPRLRPPTAAVVPAAAGVPGGWTDDVERPGARAAGAPALEMVLGTAWAAASLGLLAVFAASYARLRRQRARWTPAEVNGVPVLLAQAAGPAVVGLRRAAVVLPYWVLHAPPPERHMIVLHEREHVDAGDPWLLLGAALALAAMPWNPVLWWQHRRLRLAIEMDCDARVLARHPAPRAYGRALLRTAGRLSRLSPLALAWGRPASNLQTRILAMTATPPPRPLLRALPLLAGGLLLAGAACGVADSGEGTATMPSSARRSGHAPTRPGEATFTDHPDGTTTVRVGPQGPSVNFGLSWSYEGPIVRVPGQPVPELMPHHATVSGVLAGSPADRAGLVVGDTIVSVNGRDGRMPALFSAHGTTGATYLMRLRRGGVERELTLVVPPPRGTSR